VRSALQIVSIAAALSLAAALGVPADAAEAQVRALVDPTGQVADTEPVLLAIVVEGTDLPDVSVPSLPELINLRVVSGPSTSRSTSFEMSGMSVRRASSLTLTYSLAPLGPGRAEIPPITVRIGSETRRTEAIRLQVVSSQGPPPPSRRTGGAESGSADRGGALFLKAEAAATEVWVGQPVLLTVTLLSAGIDVQRFNWMGLPPFTNLWVEEIDSDPNAERYTTTIGERRYNAYPVLRRILVPTASGDLTVDPFSAQIGVARRTGDIFQDFFLQGRATEVVRKTDPIRLRVKPLPEAGKPADFSGGVGSFRLRASLDRRDVQANDAIALKVTVEGEGSLQSAAPPRLDLPPDVKVFEPKVSASTTSPGGRLTSKKTWEWVLVPLAPGELRIPAMHFHYFDPAQGAYRETAAEGMTVAVKRPQGGDQIARARSDVRAIRQDIAFIKPLRGRLEYSHARLYRRPGFWVLTLLPVIALPVVIAVGRRRARLREDRGLYRSRRARQRARKRLKVAERHMGDADPTAFHEDLARALVEYVADRFDRSPAGLTYDVADELLQSRGVDEALRRRFRACLEACDFARFVPDATRKERRAESAREVGAIIEQLEKVL
jgi:hypothetical protein